MQEYRQEVEKKSKVIQHQLANLSTEGRSTAAMDAHKKARANRVCTKHRPVDFNFGILIFFSSLSLGIWYYEQIIWSFNR